MENHRPILTKSNHWVSWDNAKPQIDQLIEELSIKQSNLKLHIDKTYDRDKEKELRKERKAILPDIHHRVKVLKEKKVNNHLREIERTKNDSTRMFQLQANNAATKTKIISLWINRCRRFNRKWDWTIKTHTNIF